MDYAELAASILGLSHVAIIVALSLRVIMKRRAPGVSLAWLILVILLPYVGAVLYLLMGERPLGRRRARRAEALLPPLQRWLERIPRAPGSGAEPAAWRALSRFVEGSVRLPAVEGNRLRLIEGADAILRAMIGEIDRARQSCDLEFYIWHPGGLADDVA
jgi:cardiolipin synthase A/B